MTFRLYLRRLMRLTLVVLLLSAGMASAQRVSMQRTGQPSRPSMNTQRPSPGMKQGGSRGNQEHLPQWMARHGNLSPAEQQRALEKEPGFRDLPADTQQRVRDRLTQLNNMTPEQRQRILQRNEEMERLTPPQRQQVHGAVEQYRGLPKDRQRLVARAFRDLREMPPQQRQAILDSDRFRGQFSDQERNTLSGLLAFEPYVPVQHPNDGPAYGK